MLPTILLNNAANTQYNPPENEIQILEKLPSFLPSPWDPAYLLYLEYENLCLEKEWLPQLKDIYIVRHRLNTLVCNKQEKLKFHDWVTEIAELLRKNGYFIGLNYSIQGSSIAQTLGQEWIEAVTTRIEQETGRSLTSLKEWIKTLSFPRNDIDGRIEIIGAEFLASSEIATLLENRPKHKITKIGGIAVLVSYGNWDLFIRLKKGRNHVFDGDAADMHIPFDLSNQQPFLEVQYPLGFYRSLVFGVADMSVTSDLNEHIYRAFCYRSICGKRLLRYEVMTKIFDAAFNVNNVKLAHQIELSFEKHAMPKASDARFQFLIQLICDQPDRHKWHEICFKAHVEPTASLWSHILNLQDIKSIRACLLWVGLIALRERWTLPLKASLSERAGTHALRLEAGGKCIWLSLENNPSSISWTWIQAIPWDKVQKEQSSFVYDAELNQILPKIMPKLSSDNSSERFFSMRLNTPGLRWGEIVKHHENWESAFILQCLENNEGESQIVQTLPFSNTYAIDKAIQWRCRLPRRTLAPMWLENSVWESFIKSASKEKLYDWVMYCGQPLFLKMEENIRGRILHALVGQRLFFEKEVKLLEFAKAPVNFWEKVLKDPQASSHANMLLGCTVQYIPSLARQIHPLAIACFLARRPPPEAVRLLDYWIEQGSVSLALVLWGHCFRAGLLHQWSGGWKLLLLCGEREESEFKALAVNCSNIECPDPKAWAEAALSVAPKISNPVVLQNLLRKVGKIENSDLFLLFLDTNPSLEEAWNLCHLDDNANWPSIYDKLASRVLEEKNLLWLQRFWETFLRTKSSELVKLINLTLRSDVVLADFSLLILNACRENIKDVVGHIPLLLKAIIVSDDTEQKVQLLKQWIRWQNEDGFCFVKISKAEYSKMYQLLPHVVDLYKALCMNLLFRSCSVFEDPSNFISGLIVSKRGSALLKLKEMLQWMEFCSNGLSKLTPAMQLKGFGRMMHISIVTRHVELSNQMEIAVMQYLDRTRRRSVEDSHVLMGQIRKSFYSHADIDRLQRYLYKLIAGVPSELHVTDSITCNLMLRAAEICHLLTVYTEKKGYAWFRYIPILDALNDLRIRNNYVKAVGTWINCLNGQTKMPHDSIVKASLMVNGSYGPRCYNDIEQLNRCISEILVWILSEIKRYPSSREWFTLLVLDMGKLMEENDKNKLCIPFFEAIAPYDLQVKNDSKVEAEGDRDPVMRKIRMCKNMGLLGTVVVGLTPLAGIVNAVAGRSLPVVGYVQENAMRAGIVIASTATLCMIIVLVATQVTILVRSIFPSNENLE